MRRRQFITLLGARGPRGRSRRAGSKPERIMRVGLRNAAIAQLRALLRGHVSACICDSRRPFPSGT